MPSILFARSIGVGTSGILHAVAVAWLLSLQVVTTTRPRATFAEFAVARPTPPVARPAIQAPEPKPNLTVPEPKPRNMPPRVVRADTDASPQQKAPVDLTGVTLTGQDGSGWASMTGNGESMESPLRALVVAPPQTKEPALRGEPKPGVAVASVPPAVPLHELAAKPKPPSLNAKLNANYPMQARRQGLSGKAVIVARVDGDGMVRQASIVSETSQGFCAACRMTLL